MDKMDKMFLFRKSISCNVTASFYGYIFVFLHKNLDKSYFGIEKLVQQN